MTDSLTPTLVAVAPNGGRRTHEDHPALPMTTDEMVRVALDCRDAGAGMIHLHVRNDAGEHSIDADRYLAAMKAIEREAGDSMLIQVTSESLGVFNPDEQMAMVRAVRPECVSLALRELVPDPSHEKTAADFFDWVVGEGIIPQYIIYTPEEAARLTDYRQRGIVPDVNVFCLYVLGRYSPGQKSTPDDLLPYLEAAGATDIHWAVCAFGAQERACVVSAANRGGHVRVGFENNLLMPDGEQASGNDALIAGVVEEIASGGGKIATANEAREMFKVT